MQVTLRTFVKELQNALNQAAAQRSLQLGKGQIASMEEYKKSVGYIAGLEGAGQVADQMLRSIEDQVRESEGELPEMPTIPPTPPAPPKKGKAK